MCAQPQPGAALSAEEQRALDAQLWEAAAGGDAAAVVRLAGEGASADAKDEHGEPAVVWAAYWGHTEAVEALLRLGCDPNAPNSAGGTALMYAALNGQGGVVGALLEHGGAELDAVDGVGYCQPPKLERVPAEGLLFLAYARAYRLSGVDRSPEGLVLVEGRGEGAVLEGRVEARGRLGLGGDDAIVIFGINGSGAFEN
mgnify:CR=1 FL=1